MMYPYLDICFREAIIFMTFFLTCVALVKFRFTIKTTIALLIGILAAILLCAGLLFQSGNSMTFLLTLLPLYGYLPVIIMVHILSKTGFFQTTAIWFIGLFIANSLSFLQKILIVYLALPGIPKGYFITGCLLCLACISLWFILFVLRKPFQIHVNEKDSNWLTMLFPIVMAFLLFSYFKNSVMNVMLLMLVFLTGLSIFLIDARVFVLTRKASYLKDKEKAIARQLEIQRKEYESICEKMEQGRAYRHDMRHHLRILDTLASGEHKEEMSHYIHQLDELIEANQVRTYCENTMVNAVLSSYLSQAEMIGCKVEHKIQISNTMKFDALDICSILANALENAIHAIQEMEHSDHADIYLTAVLETDEKLVFSIRNTCKKAYAFDSEGYPIEKRRQGHGIGLKSVNAITKKYNGIFQCNCENGEFQLSIILFKTETNPDLKEMKQVEQTQTKKTLVTPKIAFLCFVVFICWLPNVSKSRDTTTQGEHSSQSYDAIWGSSEIHLAVPKVELAYINRSNTETTTEETKELEEVENITTVNQESSSTITITPPTTIVWEEESDVVQKLPEIIVVPPSNSQGTSDSSKNNPPQEKPATPVKPNKPQSPEGNEPPKDTVVPPSEIQKPAVPSKPEPPQEKPTPPDLNEAVDDVNQKIAAYTETLKEKFLWYLARKYNGYVGMETSYVEIRNDDTLFILKFYGTLNVGGSEEFSRFFMIDKQNGNEIELKDLFVENSNYVEVISDEIKKQMREQVDAGLADYFIPGGIWSDEECFQAIEVDQNCYINEENKLVIVFDEYKVAPGKAGMPEFVIPTDILNDVLKQPTLLR